MHLELAVLPLVEQQQVLDQVVWQKAWVTVAHWPGSDGCLDAASVLQHSVLPDRKCTPPAASCCILLRDVSSSMRLTYMVGDVVMCVTEPHTGHLRFNIS